MSLSRMLPPRFISVMTAFATKGATAAMLFLQSVVLSRFLGVEAIGVYFFAMAIYRIGESVAPFGLPISTVREDTVLADHSLGCQAIHAHLSRLWRSGGRYRAVGQKRHCWDI